MRGKKPYKWESHPTSSRAFGLSCMGVYKRVNYDAKDEDKTYGTSLTYGGERGPRRSCEGRVRRKVGAG